MHEIGAILFCMAAWLFGLLMLVGVGFIFFLFLGLPGFVIGIILWTGAGILFLWWIWELFYIISESISYWRE